MFDCNQRIDSFLDIISSIVVVIDEDTIDELPEENIMQVQSSLETHSREILPHIVHEVGTPDLNGPESNSNNEIFAQTTTNEPQPMIVEEVQSTATDETVSEILKEMISQVIDDVDSSVLSTEPVPPTSSPESTAYSPNLPSLDDDPILLSLENPQISSVDHANIIPQDYIIIVPCSDDEDDFDDYPNKDHKETDMKKVADSSPSHQNIPCSPLIHPSLTRGKTRFSIIFIVLFRLS